MYNVQFWCASRFIKITTLIVIYFFLLFLRYFQTKPPDYPTGKEITLTGVLSDEPQIAGKIQRFTFEFVPITTWKLPEYHYGDKLRVMGMITQEPKKVMLFPKIIFIEHKEGGLMAKIITIRERVIDFYAKSLPEPAAGLLAGIVLGVKANLPSDFYNNLKMTGTMHVVAASGMNVTLVAGFLMSILWHFLGRKKALIISSIGIVFYAALAGFSASIVRASLMGFLFFLSQYLGRQNIGLLSLGLASGLMMIVNPRIIYDIGFQLSVGATGGLILLQPLLRHTFGSLARIPFIGEALMTTFAAQIATFPVLLVNFGRMSLLSPITNTLILWTIEPIMVIGGIGVIVGFFMEPLGRLFIYLSYGFLVLFIEVVNFFGRIQLFSFTFNNIPIWFGVGWYLMIIGVLRFRYNRFGRSDT
jgi:competence protein ComEC